MPTDLAQRLVADSTSVFYEALSSLRSLREDERTQLVPRVLQLLSDSATLPERRKGERAASILARGEVSTALAETLVSQVTGYSPAVRNALSTVLPPTFRGRVTVPQRVTESAALSPPEAPEPSSEHGLAVSGTVEVRAESRDTGSASIVLVLSASSDQEANATLLRNSGLDPLHFESWASARTDISTMADICGCVVDGSFIREMDGQEQLAFFRELASYSTFTWIRIDESGLRIAFHDVRESIRKARCLLAPLQADAISIQSNGALRESEIPDLLRVQEVLRSYHTVRVHPRQLSAPEGQLLIAAMRKSYEESRYDRAAPGDLLEVEFLTGGYSSARTVLVRIADSVKPEIAKIDRRERVVEEIERFYSFIQAWDPELQPRAFFHAASALILFGIVPDEANLMQPATMLGSCLEELWNAEVFATETRDFQENALHAANLTAALQRTAEKLLSLNRSRPPTTDFQPHGYPSPNFFARLSARGIDWSLAGNPLTAVDKALAQYDLLHGRAVVHGDLHLGNVLIRGGRDPHLIDYASSGPGHPAIDLVRLELALYLGILRQIESDDQYRAFQHAFSLDWQTSGQLEGRWPKIFRCATNRVCIMGCVAARDAALAAVRAHGGSERDYLAAKYLIALQNLVMHRRQSGLTRGVIDSLTPDVSCWN